MGLKIRSLISLLDMLRRFRRKPQIVSSTIGLSKAAWSTVVGRKASEKFAPPPTFLVKHGVRRKGRDYFLGAGPMHGDAFEKAIPDD